MRRFLTFFTLLAMLIFPLSSYAVTYYVAPTGNNSNPGTQGSPFLTIQKGADVVNPGDTVIVVAGTYARVTNNRSGTANARIKFKSEVRWGAKILSTAFLIFENHGQFVDIDGFEVEGGAGSAGQHGIINYVSNVRMTNNNVHSMRTYACDTDPSVGGGGITNGSYANKAENVEITGNLIHDNGGGAAAACSGGRGPHGIYQTQNGIVANNIVYNNRGWGIHLWHVPHDNIVSNNLAFNNGMGGFLVGGQEAAATNNFFYNNIARNNNRYGFEEYGSNGSSNRFINNISYSNASGGLPLVGGQASGTTTTDPLFVNWQIDGSGDYHLQAGSPGVNSGTNLAQVTCDYEGNGRPVGTQDRGPYEYLGTPSANCATIPIVALPVTHFVNNDPACSTCSDSNTPAQAEIAATAYRTANHCVANTVGGGECHILSTLPVTTPYNEYLGRTTLPVGSGYTRNVIPNGTAGNPTVIRSGTGHFAQFRPTAQATGGIAVVLLAHETVPAQYIDIINLDINGDLCSPNSTSTCNGIVVAAASNNIVIADNTVRNTHGAGGGGGIRVYSNLLVPHTITVARNTVSNTGFDTSNHGIDIQTYGNTVEDNIVFNSAGDNFHGFLGNTPGGSFRNNIIRRNIGHNNGVSRTGAGMTPNANMSWGGDTNLIYNNILYDSAGVALKIQFDTPSNNGVYNNTACGASAQSIYIESDATGTLVTNNISRNTLGIVNLGTGTILTTNILDATNPLFVNPCADTRLQDGSPAATGGTDLSAIFTTDKSGLVRSTWGMGAYIGNAGTPPVANTLVFSTPPTNVVQNVNMVPKVIVCGQFNGVTQESFVSPITLAIHTDPGTATLAGGTAVDAVAGCAEFPGVQIDDVGTGYKLRAWAINLNDAVSGLFDVLAAPVTPDVYTIHYRD